jgi:uncharacterized protein YndB with AHSA1/START domain
MNDSPDRIERKVLVKATVARVWHALSDAEEFGGWFGVALEGKSFKAGERVQGHVTYPGYEHVIFDIVIERMEPQRLMSWRWHPAAIERDVDYSKEPTTLVQFELTAVDGGTLLSVVETGLASIPLPRRRDAFRLNSSGWEAQMKNVAKHVATH